MYLLLTDILACPHCEPDSGLVLLSERIVERRVLEGALGCPSCRRQYPIRGGFADFHGAGGAAEAEPTQAEPEVGLPGSGGEEAFRLAALMGVREGPGFSLVLGGATRHAHGIAEVVPRLEVVASDPALAGQRETAGVSRIATAARLPFFSRSLRAVALSDGADAALREAGRVLAPGGRVVVLEAGAGLPDRLARAGLELLVEEGGTAVARRA